MKKKQFKAKRRTWEIKPATKVQQDKKSIYNRDKEKQDYRRNE